MTDQLLRCNLLQLNASVSALASALKETRDKLEGAEATLGVLSGQVDSVKGGSVTRDAVAESVRESVARERTLVEAAVTHKLEQGLSKAMADMAGLEQRLADVQASASRAQACLEGLELRLQSLEAGASASA